MAGPTKRSRLLRNRTRQRQMITCYKQDMAGVRVQNSFWKSFQQSPFSVQGKEREEPS